jgi:hypothetical protein
MAIILGAIVKSGELPCAIVGFFRRVAASLIHNSANPSHKHCMVQRNTAMNRPQQ